MITAKQLARDIGVTDAKVEYWERIGFIVPVSRTPTGDALYADSLAEECIRKLNLGHKSQRTGIR